MALEKAGVQLVVEGLGPFQGQLKQAEQAEKGIGTAATETSGKIGGLSKSFIGLGIAAVGIKKGIDVVTDLGKAMYNLASEAAKVDVVRNTFENLSAAIGSTSDAMLRDLRRATSGMVSDAGLMTSANRFLAMGLATTADEAGNLARIAVQLGAAMGREPTQAMEDFALLLANQSIPRLDTFGISGAKVRERILELQAAMPGLSRETAFMQATMEQANITLGKVGDVSTTTAGRQAALRATFANFKDQLGQALLPALDALVRKFQGLATEYGPSLTAAISRLAGVVGSDQFLGALGTFVDLMVQAANVTADATETFSLMIDLAGQTAEKFGNTAEAAWFLWKNSTEYRSELVLLTSDFLSGRISIVDYNNAIVDLANEAGVTKDVLDGFQDVIRHGIDGMIEMASATGQARSGFSGLEEGTGPMAEQIIYVSSALQQAEDGTWGLTDATNDLVFAMDTEYNAIGRLQQQWGETFQEAVFGVAGLDEKVQGLTGRLEEGGEVGFSALHGLVMEAVNVGQQLEETGKAVPLDQLELFTGDIDALRSAIETADIPALAKNQLLDMLTSTQTAVQELGTEAVTAGSEVGRAWEEAVRDIEVPTGEFQYNWQSALNEAKESGTLAAGEFKEAWMFAADEAGESAKLWALTLEKASDDAYLGASEAAKKTADDWYAAMGETEMAVGGMGDMFALQFRQMSATSGRTAADWMAAMGDAEVSVRGVGSALEELVTRSPYNIRVDVTGIPPELMLKSPKTALQHGLEGLQAWANTNTIAIGIEMDDGGGWLPPTPADPIAPLLPPSDPVLIPVQPVILPPEEGGPGGGGISPIIRQPIWGGGGFGADFITRGLGGIVGTASTLFKRQLGAEIGDLDKQIETLKAEMAAGPQDIRRQTVLRAQLNNLEKERERILEKQAAHEEKMAALEEKRLKLQFLQQQLDLLGQLKEAGIDPEGIFGGLTLGMEANMDDLIEAMGKAMEALIAKAQETLEAGSPSKVMMGLGEGIMQGLALGMQDAVMLPIAQMRQATAALVATPQTVAAPQVFRSNTIQVGPNTVQSPMDVAVLEAMIQRVVVNTI